MTSPNHAESHSVGNMETKISNMILRLKMRKELGLFSLPSLPVAYALEFPSTVVRVHATNFGVLASFQRTNCDLTVPVEVTMKEKTSVEASRLLTICLMDLVTGKPSWWSKASKWVKVREEENKACL